MRSISFQGVCLFWSKPTGCTVFLPRGDVESTHMDGTSAAMHHARIFVPEGEYTAQSGFAPVQCDGVSGIQFSLSNGQGSPSYRIEVTPQQTFLSDHITKVLSFQDFAPAWPCTPLDGSAAMVPISGGTLVATSTERTNWKIADWRSPGGDDHEIGDIAWKVDWFVGERDQPVRITVYNGAFEAGHVVLKPGIGSYRPGVIIGNLDTPNGAEWPNRKPIQQSDCKGTDGKTDTSCPDLDFKWYYRLFKTSTVEETMRDIKKTTTKHSLPVPKVASPVIGVETPTCFPAKV